MGYANALRVLRRIYRELGRPSQQVLPHADVQAARIAAGWEVLQAIASNSRHSYFGSYASLVTVANDAFLPAHDGEPGIPVIVPFSGAPAVEGLPETPGRVGSYRDPALAFIYSGGADGAVVPHNVADVAGVASPTAARYSLVAKRFKFTGFSAQVPLIQLTRAMADTLVPEVFEATLVRLAVPPLVSGSRGLEGFAEAAKLYAAAAAEDLAAIRDGAVAVPPLPDVTIAQKGGVV